MVEAANPFLKRYSVEAATAWVDEAVDALDKEDAPLRTAQGLMLVEDIRAIRALPAEDRAAVDGFAVQASASLGASAYNPIRLPLIAVASGDALPAGTDAVVPRELAEPEGESCIEIVEVVAAAEHVQQQGAVSTIGATLVCAGTRLAARHIGLLLMAGVSRVPVVRGPRVRVLVTTPTKGGGWVDSDGPMICAAVERDGGVVKESFAVERNRTAITAALVKTGVDIVLVIGGTGRGSDDHAAGALAAAGKLALHGVALLPGETAGLGHTASKTPVVLLPGAPAACLWSYELFAGRAIRRLGGRNPELPFRSREVMTTRKIVSTLGMTEICPVRFCDGETVAPLPSFAEIGLMAAVGADGFVIVPQGSEGFPESARISVHLYGEC
jgi:molybdopterin molybdotransferase